MTFTILLIRPSATHPTNAQRYITAKSATNPWNFITLTVYITLLSEMK